jgi:hypothetical protein
MDGFKLPFCRGGIREYVVDDCVLQSARDSPYGRCLVSYDLFRFGFY